MTEVRSLRTLIVDDEPLAVERLQILSARLPGIQLAGTATDGEAALRMVEALQPDLLLLDIAMPGLDGIEVARALERQPTRPAVIFDRLERAVTRVRGLLDAEPAPAAPSPSRWTTEFWVPHRAEIVRVAADDLDLIEAERDYMRLHVGPRSYLLHQTITELERRLDPAAFIRLHRSTIVRRDRIKGLRHDGDGAWSAELGDGRLVRIGRTYLSAAKAMIGR
jgi:two-component system response regulator AlgR